MLPTLWSEWEKMYLTGLGKLSLALLAALSVSACVGSFADGDSGRTLIDQSASRSEIEGAAPTAFPIVASKCPEMRIRQGAEAFAVYASSRSTRPGDLRYQAVIDKHSRNCLVSNGLITVKMGVVGRLLAGPKADGPETIKVPVRFAVERDNMAVFSQKYDIPVAISPPSQGEEFIKIVEDVAIPYVGGEDIVIWVGFDLAG